MRDILSGVFAVGRALDTLEKDLGDERAQKAAARFLFWCTDLELPSGLGADVDRRIGRVVATAKLLLGVLTAPRVDLVTLRAAVARLDELHAKLESDLMTAGETMVREDRRQGPAEDTG